jgi:hypothetical protein
MNLRAITNDFFSRVVRLFEIQQQLLDEKQHYLYFWSQVTTITDWRKKRTTRKPQHPRTYGNLDVQPVWGQYRMWDARVPTEFEIFKDQYLAFYENCNELSGFIKVGKILDCQLPRTSLQHGDTSATIRYYFTRRCYSTLTERFNTGRFNNKKLH